MNSGQRRSQSGLLGATIFEMGRQRRERPVFLGDVVAGAIPEIDVGAGSQRQ